MEASNTIDWEIRRARSQWAISYAGVVPSLRHELFVGTVEIEDKVTS